MITPGTGQQQEWGAAVSRGKECTRVPSLPAVVEAVLLPSRKTSHLLPLVFMRNIYSPLCLFSYASDFPASLRGRRSAEKPLSVSQNRSVASHSHFSTPDLLLSGGKIIWEVTGGFAVS